MRRSAQRTQRRIATLALLIASFLEICGCNPVQTCDQMRTMRLSAMPFETLIERCARCLSEQELTVLQRARQRPPTQNPESAMLRDATVEETLGELHGPSFDTFSEGGPETIRGEDASSDAPTGEASLQQARPIAWPIPESVLFLYAAPPGAPRLDSSAHPGNPPRRIATGFILSVPEQRGRSSKYLVTARHVVDPEWARCGVTNPPSITVRFNRWGGGVGYESIPLDAHHGRPFITAGDDVTDLVLIPLDAERVPRLNGYKLAATVSEDLPNDSELGALHQEQQIVTVGVSGPKLAGLTESPISEPGVIATDVSGVPVGVRCTVGSPVKPIHMWLINATVESGISGAPVYAAISRGPHRLTKVVLVGIQAVVWPGKGQAGITPVAALRDLIQQERTRGEVAMDFRKGHPD